MPHYFKQVSDGEFDSTELTRGPWSLDHQHAGPPSALIARQVEKHLDDPGFHIARITIDIVRPVPIGRLVVRIQDEHTGRAVRTLRSELHGAGKLLAVAHVVAIRYGKTGADHPDPGFPVPAHPGGIAENPFPFFADRPGYHETMELRFASGSFAPGPATVWFRMKCDVVQGEPASPLQRVMAAADSGNGVSSVLDINQFTFVNPDLTVHLHQYPSGEWICLDATTTTNQSGIGQTRSILYDEHGQIGTAVQDLLVASRQ